MSTFFRYIFLLAALVLIPVTFVSCADEHEGEYADDDLEIMVAAQWKCGRTMAGRVGTDPIPVVEADYPQLLHITVGDGADKQRPATHPATFVVGKTMPDDNTGYTAYHDQYRVENLKFDASGLHAILDAANSTKEQRPLYSKSVLKGLRVEANTLSPRFDGSTQANIPQAWDNTDIPTIGRRDHLTTKEAFGGSTKIDGNHLFLTLGHVTALLRLHFAVSAEYSAGYSFDLKSVTINNQPIVAEAHLNLTTEQQLFGRAYLKPERDNSGNLIAAPWDYPVNTSTSLTFRCTYDVYNGGNLSYPNKVATNTVTLNSSSIKAIKAGYYYDLYITINPSSTTKALPSLSRPTMTPSSVSILPRVASRECSLSSAAPTATRASSPPST